MYDLGMKESLELTLTSCDCREIWHTHVGSLITPYDERIGHRSGFFSFLTILSTKFDALDWLSRQLDTSLRLGLRENHFFPHVPRIIFTFEMASMGLLHRPLR